MNSGNLYICPTPIGNLDDITVRVLNTLREVDLIAAEDTRHTIKLLNHFDIKKPLISYHEHNESTRSKELIDRILGGESVAVVSDAGMPGISDPGHVIVKEAIKNGVEPIVLPGASAFTIALVGSGLNTDRFTFIGFLDRSKKKKKNQLQELIKRDETMIFYVSPHRLKLTLEIMAEVLGDRKICLCKELTKKFENFIRGNITEVIAKLDEGEIRGEYVLIVDGLNDDNKKYIDDKYLNESFDGKDELSDLSDREAVLMLIEDGISKKDAIKKVSKDRNKSKNEVYQQVLDI